METDLTAPMEQGHEALPRVAAINRLLDTAWRRGILPEPSLNPEMLERLAVGDKHDWRGDEEWRTPFRLLCHSLADEAHLNPLGRTMAHGQIVKAIRQRRRALRLWSRHPEILRKPVEAPVIVLGPMRSGTTRIQRLLACDPRFSHTRLFESLTPVPPSGPLDGRPLSTRLGYAFLRSLNPRIHDIHPTGARHPEEEFGLFSFSFGSAQFEAQWHVPAFVRWWEGTEVTFLYNDFRRLLQTMAWHRKDRPGNRWLLKAPQFGQDLAAVLDAFPDARLLCLDRDVEEVVGSSASLIWNQMRIQSDRVDRSAIGREWLRKTLLRQDRVRAVRAARPDVPQLDVVFSAVNRDWRAEISRIYAFLDMRLLPEVEQRMARYVDTAKAHLRHSYALEDFNLAPHQIATAANRV